jgi:hypothetical protein
MIWNLIERKMPKDYEEVLGMTKENDVYIVSHKGDNRWYDERIFSTPRDIVKWCEITKSNNDFKAAAMPLIKYLSENHHPHVTAIITPTSCELMEGLKLYPMIYDYVVD